MIRPVFARRRVTAAPPRRPTGNQSRHDVVVRDAGHKGVVAAAYLAKVGNKVLVVERPPHVRRNGSTKR